jgi:multiple sugar transport system substrate-binding protein
MPTVHAPWATRRSLLLSTLPRTGPTLATIAAVACRPRATPSDTQPAPLLTRPTTIEVLHEFAPQSTHGQALAWLLERLRELAPILTVKASPTAGDSWVPLQTMLAAGTPPDVSETYVANAASLGAKKISEPLQSLLKGARDWELADYFDGPREAFTYRGDLVLAPIFTAPMAVAINLDMLGRAGLRPPAPAWTWDAFTEYAVALTQRSGSEVSVYGAAMPTGGGYAAMNFFGGPLWSHGGDWADRTTGTLTFHRPEGVAALEMWVHVALKRQAAPTAPPQTWQGLQGGAFINGMAAMAFIASPETANYLRQAPGFAWTTVPMPRQKQQGAHFYSHGWFVLRDAKAKSAAGEFVRLASLPEHIAQWNVTTSGMPTRRRAAALQAWQEHLRSQPPLVAFNEATAYMRSYPAIPGWNEAAVGPEGIGQGIINAVQGKAEPRQALDEAARRAAVVLAQHAA